MSWVYDAKFIEDEKPRHFTAEKQLTVREIQERCGVTMRSLERFNATRVDDDNEKSD